MFDQSIPDSVRLVANFRELRPGRYEYQFIRHRQIFEALTQGVYYAFGSPVAGDIAEFGTAGGFTALTIAHAMAFYDKIYAAPAGTKDRTLFLFDSFQGLPGPDAVDKESPNVVSGKWSAGAYRILDRSKLMAVCSAVLPPERIAIFEGWFADSLPTMPADIKLALVHLDCDLYSSTVQVLDHLLARRHLADGALLLFDDWNCNAASPRFGQRRAWQEMVEKHNVKFSDGGDYAMFGHKFIVHVDGES